MRAEHVLVQLLFVLPAPPKLQRDGWISNIPPHHMLHFHSWFVGWRENVKTFTDLFHEQQYFLSFISSHRSVELFCTAADLDSVSGDFYDLVPPLWPVWHHTQLWATRCKTSASDLDMTLSLFFQFSFNLLNSLLASDMQPLGWRPRAVFVIYLHIPSIHQAPTQ